VGCATRSRTRRAAERDAQDHRAWIERAVNEEAL
jgi:hypothetical protein